METKLPAMALHFRRDWPGEHVMFEEHLIGQWLPLCFALSANAITLFSLPPLFGRV